MMANLFHMGGPLFMGILTVLLVVLLAVSVYFFIAIASGKAGDKENFKHQLSYVKSIGLFTMITGILGQLIGLLSAFQAIEEVGDISPAMLAGGLKVSMITTLYGVFIYLFSIVLWFLLDLWYLKKSGK
jgi:biopolymer transport protein ExbB/TolQ